MKNIESSLCFGVFSFIKKSFMPNYLQNNAKKLIL